MADHQVEIERMQAEINRLRRLQETCRHVWGEPFVDHYVDREPIIENRPMGSDYFNPVTVGGRDVPKSRWCRTCTLCGSKRFTAKMEPIVVGHRPVFGD